MFKKVLCLLLIMLGVISFSGCRKNDVAEKINTPQYATKYFNRTALKDIASQFTGPQAEIQESLKVIENIDGKIIDVFIFNEKICFLTDKTLSFFDSGLLTCGEYKIDRKDNTKIVLMTNDFFVLKNSKNEYTMYAPLECLGTKYVAYPLKNLNVSDTDVFIAGQNKDDVFLSTMEIVKKINKNSIVVETYHLKNKWSPDVKLVKYGAETINFSQNFKEEIKDYYFHSDKNTSNGYIVSTNNNLYRAYQQEDFQETKTLLVNTDVISDIEKLFLTSYNNEVLFTKKSDKNTVYDVTYDYSFSDKIISIINNDTISLPNGFTTDNIKEIMFDGDIFLFNNNECFKEEDVGLYEKNSILTETFKKGNAIAKFDVSGLYCFVMDDGFIYTLIDDSLINGWNLSY